VAHAERVRRLQATQPMGPGHYAERAVPLIAIIEMDSNRQHLLENSYRRLNEYLALFLRPPRAQWTIDSVRNRNRKILVERHEPVPPPRLGEQCALNRDGGGRKHSTHAVFARKTVCERIAPQDVDQTPFPCTCSREIFDAVEDLVDLLRPDQIRDNGIS